MATKDNFFTNTTADFKQIFELPKTEPDYISIYKRKFRVYKEELDECDCIDYNDDGEVAGVVFFDYDNEELEYYNVIKDFDDFYLVEAEKGVVISKYWYLEIGVTRVSNHWGTVANCIWTLENQSYEAESGEKIGFCNWNDFIINN